MADSTPGRGADWLGRLAHDLRNPITPMRSAVQLLQLGQLPAELAPDLLRTLDRQIDYLLRLIDDVADLVRIEQGGFRVRRATCDLGQVAASAVARHARTTGQGGRAPVPVAVHAPDAPVWVHADEVRLRQLVESLLGVLGDGVEAPGAGVLRIERDADAALLRFGDPAQPLRPDARLDYLATGDLPEDPSALSFGQLVARRILADHDARLERDADGATLVLRLPAADPAADD